MQCMTDIDSEAEGGRIQTKGPEQKKWQVLRESMAERNCKVREK